MQAKGGKCIVINDSGKEYDTEEVEEYLSYTQGLIKRLTYVRYVGTKDLLSDNRCSKYKANRVREVLNKDNNVERIENVFGYSIKETNYYIDFAKAFIPMMRQPPLKINRRFFGGDETEGVIRKRDFFELYHERRTRMFKNELPQSRYREKLRRSLISQLESQKTNIEPFLDNVDRHIGLQGTAISLEEDISESGIKLENGKKNESVALLASASKQMGLMLDKSAITSELVGEANEPIPEL